MAYLSFRRHRTWSIMVASILVMIISSSAFAALCVWRRPDQDIKEFFPGADTYRTEIKNPRAKKAAIERRIGTKLDPDETEFTFYRILSKGKPVGTVLTHLGRGQFGAIEVVIALDNSGKVRGTKIQRDRERQRAELRSPNFLNQFKGKTVNSPIKLGQDIKPVKGAERSSETVAFSVKKMLVIHDELK